MKSQDKFASWLAIYQMEDYAPEMVPGFTAMMDLLDFLKPNLEFFMDHLDKIISTKLQNDSCIRLSDRQYFALKKIMAHYALSACMDSAIRKEAENICNEISI